MQWNWQLFSDLSGEEVHDILAIRQQVFIVEQNCVYQDADEYDSRSWHLTGRRQTGEIDVYARLLWPGSRFTEPAIGRLLTRKSMRKKGLARDAVIKVLAKCRKEYSGKNIKISAQVYLKDFYSDFGFKAIGEQYDEDGIDHIEMIVEMKK